MRAGPTLLLLVLLALAAFAFAIFGGIPAQPGQRHWAAAPLLAFSILFSMGGLVAAMTARLGSLK